IAVGQALRLRNMHHGWPNQENHAVNCILDTNDKWWEEKTNVIRGSVDKSDMTTSSRRQRLYVNRAGMSALHPGLKQFLNRNSMVKEDATQSIPQHPENSSRQPGKGFGLPS
ncbi:hypothetical protein LSAT2_006778, partial [Lamellibrachia satsuma]